MATSDFKPFVDEILDEAWERCGHAPNVLKGETAISCRRSLQLTLIDFQDRGLNLWREEMIPITTVAGVNTFTMPDSTIDILNCYVQDPMSGNELPMSPLPRTDYLAMPVKSQPGQPNLYWPQRSLPPVVHFFPTPDKAYTIHIWRIRQPYDVAHLNQVLDLPVRWAEAITAALAASLAKKFVTDPQRRAELRADAVSAYRAASSEERERTPFTVLPDFGPMRL